MYDVSSAENSAPGLEHLRQSLRASMEQGRLELPLLPSVAAQVIQVTSDSECDAKKLSHIIHRDQSMAGHVLRLANSAFYMPRMPIVSLQQAVSRLGLKMIREIALIISCQSRVFQVKGFEPEVHALFRHSLAAGAFAQEIARMRRWNVEEAFLCGLLHDVGKPVVLQAVTDLVEPTQALQGRAELLALVDEFHTQAGSQLVENWKLPARLGETILYHHDPQSAPAASQTARMTQLADDLSHLTVGPRALDEESIRKHPMLVSLNLYPNEVEHLLGMRQGVASMVEVIS